MSAFSPTTKNGPSPVGELNDENGLMLVATQSVGFRRESTAVVSRSSFARFFLCSLRHGWLYLHQGERRLSFQGETAAYSNFVFRSLDVPIVALYLARSTSTPTMSRNGLLQRHGGRSMYAAVPHQVWLRTEEYLKDALGSVVADIEDMAVNLLTFVNEQVRSTQYARLCVCFTASTCASGISSGSPRLDLFFAFSARPHAFSI